MHMCKVHESGIAKDVVMGRDVTVVMPSNLYGCELGDDVFIGPFCEVQRDVVIGARTRIQSHSFVCSKVTIGADCFIAHGVVFTNDRLRKGRVSYTEEDWEATLVQDGVTIGSGATILPVTIVSGVVVGAGSVVTKDLTEPGVYVGSPARLLKRLN
jgi:acetyltransferase-like isoleucine patch superfamily enzyme